MIATWEIREGDVLDRLREMPDQSVQCCVTSPPYWGLRDYGCDGQIGLESSPELFVAKMVEVFAEVRRVLRDDGTCWINLGDSYARMQENNVPQSKNATCIPPSGTGRIKNAGLKPKDLVGIPWRVALALQADGWYLRSDIIWHKPNPMPESVTDRCTKSHEYIFMLAKSERYFFDADAIKESAITSGGGGFCNKSASKRSGSGLESDIDYMPDGTRNKRTVWTIATQSYAEAHFATFPEELPRLCISAGTSEKGCCPHCRTPWSRVTETTYENPGNRTTNGPRSIERKEIEYGTAGFAQRLEKRVSTTGWQPGCNCVDVDTLNGIPDPVPCVVLEPFAGSGTTLSVARQLGRHSIGIELNPEYAELARKRIMTAGREKNAISPLQGQKDLFAFTE